MQYLVKARVDTKKITEFGQKLQKGKLNRSLIRSDTYCLSKDPAIGYSIWESESREKFDRIFKEWKIYYSETEIMEVINPNEAMKLLMQRK